MKFEHVSFNKDFWKGKPLKQFLKEESHHGLTVEQLTEAHKLINHEEQAPEEAKTEDSADAEKGSIKKDSVKQNA